jgi:UDP-N-acetylglucosamine transferase subunit ALG13
MIFVTIGTSEPFDRLTRAVDALQLDEELVVQGGDSSFRPKGAAFFDYVDYDRLLKLMTQARVVVMHAGVGSILTAVAVGKRPIVVPRLRRYHEAVDDHQLVFAQRLAAENAVLLIDDLAGLGHAVASGAGASGEAMPRRGSSLAADLGSVISSFVRGDAVAAASG